MLGDKLSPYLNVDNVLVYMRLGTIARRFISPISSLQ